MTMRIEDLIYILTQADRPGRSLLRVSWEANFKQVQAESGGGHNIPLPVAEVGFTRLWTHLSFIASAHVATDLYQLGINFGGGLNSTLMDIHANALNCATSEVPLIDGLLIRAGVPANSVIVFKGMPAQLVGGPDMVLTFLSSVTPASGQTVTVNGRYVDLPV